MNKTALTYKEVFQLAQEKGYILQVPFIESLYESGRPDLYEYAEYDAGLCELTLIQKWLRDKHKILVFVDRTLVERFEEPIEFRWWIESKEPTTENGDYSTYEEALLHGIAEALTMI